jgi:hypothetical protein
MPYSMRLGGWPSVQKMLTQTYDHKEVKVLKCGNPKNELIQSSALLLSLLGCKADAFKI